jgi:hypothetical protein
LWDSVNGANYGGERRAASSKTENDLRTAVAHEGLGGLGLLPSEKQVAFNTAYSDLFAEFTARKSSKWIRVGGATVIVASYIKMCFSGVTSL